MKDELEAALLEAAKDEAFDASEFLKKKAMLICNSGRYNGKLVEVICDKMIEIHEFLAAAVEKQVSYANLEATIKLPDSVPADDFVLYGCHRLADTFLTFLINRFDWYKNVKFSGYTALNPELIRFYVSIDV